jgi:hypothetical protein
VTEGRHAGAIVTPMAGQVPLDEMPRVAYRGPAAVAIDGTEPWSVDRLISTDGGRWSHPRQPTIYVAADPGVALAEFGRHLPSGQTPVGSLWTLRLALDDVADLRDTPNHVALDQDRCRALADELRGEGVPGLIVPSVAFLDKRQRCNIVMFAEVLGAAVADAIRDPRLLARIAPA